LAAVDTLPQRTSALRIKHFSADILSR